MYRLFMFGIGIAGCVYCYYERPSTLITLCIGIIVGGVWSDVYDSKK